MPSSRHEQIRPVIISPMNGRNTTKIHDGQWVCAASVMTYPVGTSLSGGPILRQGICKDRQLRWNRRSKYIVQHQPISVSKRMLSIFPRITGRCLIAKFHFYLFQQDISKILIKLIRSRFDLVFYDRQNKHCAKMFLIWILSSRYSVLYYVTCQQL